MSNEIGATEAASETTPLTEWIRKPEPVAIRDLWPSEPADFTPWLAKNLEELDVLKIGSLSLIDTEISIPGTGRALDILAETSEGLVAIENQYSMADHDHLTRGLAYAIGLEATVGTCPVGAPTVICLAAELAKEFEPLWLRGPAC